MLRPASTLSLLTLLAGCAASSGIPETRTDQTVVAMRGSGTSGDMVLTRTAAIASEAVAAPPEAAWSALSQTFADLGITANQVNPGTRMIGATGQRIRRIDGKSPAAFFSCPGAYGNGAARDDVYITVRSQVLPGEGSGSTVRTEVSAVSKSTTTATTTTDCSSNGTLEKLIADRVRARVGNG